MLTSSGGLLRECKTSRNLWEPSFEAPCDPAHLAGDVAVAGHVAVARVHDVAVDLLVQRCEGGNVGVWLAVDHGHLQVYCSKSCTSSIYGTL